MKSSHRQNFGGSKFSQNGLKNKLYQIMAMAIVTRLLPIVSNPIKVVGVVIVVGFVKKLGPKHFWSKKKFR